MATVQTTVTSADVVAAQGGLGGGDDRVWVECPEGYDAESITAEDIVCDGRIRVVPAPTREGGETGAESTMTTTYRVVMQGMDAKGYSNGSITESDAFASESEARAAFASGRLHMNADESHEVVLERVRLDDEGDTEIAEIAVLDAQVR